MFGLSLVQGFADFGDIVSINRNHLPAPSLVFQSDILRIHFVHRGGELNIICIVEHDEVVQTQCAGDTTGSLRDFLLDAAVGNIRIDSLSHHIAQTSFQELGSDCSTYGIRMPLSQRTRSIFYTTQDINFRMSWRYATPLAEIR